MTIQQEVEINRAYGRCWAVIIVGAMAGIIARISGAISPVHEIMHCIVGILGGAQIVSLEWNYTVISRDVPGFFQLPYIMEIGFYFLLSLRGIKILGAFGLGALLALPLRAWFSQDYAEAGGDIYVVFTVLWLIFVSLALWRMIKKVGDLEAAHESISPVV